MNCPSCGRPFRVPAPAARLGPVAPDSDIMAFDNPPDNPFALPTDEPDEDETWGRVQ